MDEATLTVSVVALAVAAVTLFFVVIADIRQRRLMPTADLTLQPYGTGKHLDTGETVRIWRLTNTGTANARIWVLIPVGCEFLYDEEYPPIEVLPVGESARLAVWSDDAGKAWVFIAWTSTFGHRTMVGRWIAPEPGPELEAERDRQSASLQGWRNRLMWRLRRRLCIAQPVGPGGAAGTAVRTRHRRTEQALAKMRSLAMPERPPPTSPPES